MNSLSVMFMIVIVWAAWVLVVDSSLMLKLWSPYLTWDVAWWTASAASMIASICMCMLLEWSCFSFVRFSKTKSAWAGYDVEDTWMLHFLDPQSNIGGQGLFPDVGLSAPMIRSNQSELFFNFKFFLTPFFDRVMITFMFHKSGWAEGQTWQHFALTNY